MTGASMAVLATTAALSTGYSVYAGEKGRQAQEKAQQEAKAQAEKQAKAADEAYNAAHQKKANIPGTLDAAGSMAGQGAPSTMLTGSGAQMPGSSGSSSLLGEASIPGNLSMKKSSTLGA